MSLPFEQFINTYFLLIVKMGWWLFWWEEIV